MTGRDRRRGVGHRPRRASAARAPLHVGEAQLGQPECGGEPGRLVAIVGVRSEAVDVRHGRPRRPRKPPGSHGTPGRTPIPDFHCACSRSSHPRRRRRPSHGAHVRCSSGMAPSSYHFNLTRLDATPCPRCRVATSQVLDAAAVSPGYGVRWSPAPLSNSCRARDGSRFTRWRRWGLGICDALGSLYHSRRRFVGHALVGSGTNPEGGTHDPCGHHLRGRSRLRAGELLRRPHRPEVPRPRRRASSQQDDGTDAFVVPGMRKPVAARASSTAPGSADRARWRGPRRCASRTCARRPTAARSACRSWTRTASPPSSSTRRSGMGHLHAPRRRATRTPACKAYNRWLQGMCSRGARADLRDGPDRGAQRRRGDRRLRSGPRTWAWSA